LGRMGSKDPVGISGRTSAVCVYAGEDFPALISGG